MLKDYMYFVCKHDKQRRHSDDTKKTRFGTCIMNNLHISDTLMFSIMIYIGVWWNPMVRFVTIIFYNYLACDYKYYLNGK